mgnify:CR=1 FL=1
MQTGIISFANRIVQNIKSNDSKDLILKQLYSLYKIQILQKQHHRLDENNIKHVVNNFHLCSLRSNGNPYLIFFTLYNDIPIIYFIDKKIHPGYQKPRILIVRGLFNHSLFQNTLIDGEMVKKEDGKWLFLMNDIISYEGNYLSNVPLTERLKILYKILDTQYTPDSIIDVCEYKIKNYYYVSKEGIQELLKLADKLNYTCRGIYMWSSNFRYKNKLMNFNDDCIVNVVRKVKDETNFQTLEEKQPEVELPLEKKEIETLRTDKSNIYWMIKTDTPDVYELFNEENIIKATRIGVALIPDIKTSKTIREIMKNKNVSSSVKVECCYNDKFKKWYPVRVF